jgi:hypothetical protein
MREHRGYLGHEGLLQGIALAISPRPGPQSWGNRLGMPSLME